MLLFLTLILIAMIFFIIKKKSIKYNVKEWADSIIWISCSIFVVALLALPFAHLINKNFILNYNATKATIEQARTEEFNEIEKAAITKEIIEVNSWLTRTQYWNQTAIWGIFVPDVVMELELLK